MLNTPLLEISNLWVDFVNDMEVQSAIKDISFRLFKNETLAIVGESGSGKSVTALSVMGLLPSPSAKIINGEILYSATDVKYNLTKTSEKVFQTIRGKEIAMIFQEPMTSLNPVRTCGSQLSESILVHHRISKKEAKKRALSLLVKVKLPKPEKAYSAYPFELSGGQKQRVMIAMAVSCNPKVLIADEPTTALDVSVQKDILTLLKDLQNEYGMGMIYISHDLAVVADIADRVIVMYKGNIVEQNDINSIFSAPAHPYTKGLLACRAGLHQKGKKLHVISDFNLSAPEINNFALEKLPLAEIKNNGLAKSDLSKALLEVNKLQTSFVVKRNIFGKAIRHYQAVEDVSFKVFPGETLGLVGESGCGKTTLGRSIMQLIKPDSGEIYYKSELITQLSKSKLRKLRKEIQIIFQDPFSSLNPRITTGNAIMEPMLVHKTYPGKSACKAKTIELLERVGLNESHFNRYPHEFSGGQRQRICIARALAVSPKFIICDESVSALDVSVQAQVLNLLNELKLDFGFTYIFISHDLSVVKYMSDRIIVMKNGQIVETGTVAEIFSNPLTDYTRMLINAVPKIKYHHF